MKKDHKRFLILLSLGAIVPILWSIVNSQEFYKAGQIYIIMALVLVVFYGAGRKWL